MRKITRGMSSRRNVDSRDVPEVPDKNDEVFEDAMVTENCRQVLT